MSVHPRVVHKRRATITDLPLYFSGYLLKKNTEEKEFKKYYGELRGATLFLYEDDTQDTYTEKLDLEQIKHMELECPYLRKPPTIFTLTLHTQEVQLKMDNPDTGEEWRGYMLTVIKKEIPSKLQLLPGQMLLLQEVLLQEKRRNPPLQRPPLPPRPSFIFSTSSSPPLPKNKPDHSAPEIPDHSAPEIPDHSAPEIPDHSAPEIPDYSAPEIPDYSAPEIPACFFNVTRQEAEQMLEAKPECGSIIIRPSTLLNNYALTLRQLTPSGPVMRNYRVTTTKSGFVIELETAVKVSTLNDVVKYFLEKTEHRLHPYMDSQPYDTRIEVSPAPKCISIISPAPKKVPKAQVAPMLRSKTKEKFLPPPTRPEEGEYVVPDDDDKLKKVHLEGELREVLKLRRETISAAADKEEVSTYENQTTEKSHSGTAQWTTKFEV